MNTDIKKRITVPNILTALRLLGSVVIFVLYVTKTIKPLGITFYIIYSLCGVTDLLDGFIARKTHSTSKFGARLDSVADLAFYASMFVIIFPILLEVLPPYIWIFIGIVLAIRLTAYIVAAIRFKCFASSHSILNKITGGGVFLLPYFISLGSFFVVYAGILCGVSLAAAVSEVLIYLFKKSYTPEEHI